jgi:hypothetical protein
MMRAELDQAHVAIELCSSDFIDLSATPWRRITLSARDNVWALVDAIDFDWLAENTWNVWHAGRGKEWQLYAKRNIEASRATVRMHREILIKQDIDQRCPRADAFLATHVGDHGNGQTLDNRRANLSWATKQQNAINRRRGGTAPSLDSIVLQLMAQHGFSQPQEVPF